MTRDRKTVFDYQPPDLIKFIQSGFKKDEIESLCVDISSRYPNEISPDPLDYEDLGGTGKKGKIRELVNYFYRRNIVSCLIREIIRQRPNRFWTNELKIKNPDCDLHRLQEQIGTHCNRTDFSRFVQIFALEDFVDDFDSGNIAVLVFEVASKEPTEITILIGEIINLHPDIDWQKGLQINSPCSLALLARVLINQFDSLRLSQLFRKLHVDYETSIGQSQHHKVIASIFEVVSKEEIPKLITQAWQDFPEINWPELLYLSEAQIHEWQPNISHPEDGVQEILDCDEPSTNLFLQLQNHGYTRNPFRRTSRYAEEDSLFLCPAPNFDAFVRPSKYEEIIRGKSSLSPGTPYIFGAPGTGKTLLCRYIEYDFNQIFLKNYGFEKPILAVQYNFQSTDLRCFGIHEKSRTIVDTVLQTLNKMTRLEYLGLKSERQMRHLTLMRAREISSYSLLEEMIHSLFDIDIGGVCILIDCSQASEQVDVERVFHSIKGLVDRYDLLTIPGLLFKFFLPLDLMNIYKDNLPIDKFKPYTIQWSKEHLQKMLISRISFCRQQEEQRSESTDVAWGSFIGLFDPKSQFELFEVSDDGQMVLKDSMLESIEFNPRQMLQLCRQKLQNRLDDVGGL